MKLMVWMVAKEKLSHEIEGSIFGNDRATNQEGKTKDENVTKKVRDTVWIGPIAVQQTTLVRERS
jgi:hypothetical protein